jgi:hypothetical protein
VEGTAWLADSGRIVARAVEHLASLLLANTSQRRPSSLNMR